MRHGAIFAVVGKVGYKEGAFGSNLIAVGHLDVFVRIGRLHAADAELELLFIHWGEIEIGPGVEYIEAAVPAIYDRVVIGVRRDLPLKIPPLTRDDEVVV